MRGYQVTVYSFVLILVSQKKHKREVSESRIGLLWCQFVVSRCSTSPPQPSDLCPARQGMPKGRRTIYPGEQLCVSAACWGPVVPSAGSLAALLLVLYLDLRKKFTTVSWPSSSTALLGCIWKDTFKTRCSLSLFITSEKSVILMWSLCRSAGSQALTCKEHFHHFIIMRNAALMTGETMSNEALTAASAHGLK